MGRKKQRRKQVACANCKLPLKPDANFCPNCGQENHEHVVSLKLVLKDFLSDYLAYDSKLLAALRLLLFKPGMLTVKYSAGKRVEFVPPIRLYLFLSVFYFLILSLQPGTGIININTGPPTEQVTDSVSADPNNPARLESAQDQSRLSLGMRQFAEASRAEKRRLIIRSFTWMMVVLLPIFALILKWFYRKKQKFYVEHLVFALHVHAFMYLFYALTGIVELIAQPEEDNAFFASYLPALTALISIWYLLKALKTYYGDGYGKTGLKLILSLALYAIAFAFCFLGTFLLTIALL